MVDTITLILLVIIIGFFLVLVILAVLAMWRKMKAYRLHLRIDYRNPSAGGRMYWAVVDTKSKTIDYYNNLFAFKAVKYAPLVYDPASFADDKKNINVIRSPTGNPKDNLDVPEGHALNSQAAANHWAKTMSNSITSILPFYDTCLKNDFRIGEFVNWNSKKDKKEIKAKIIDITYKGIVISYPNDEYKEALAANKNTEGISKMIHKTFDSENYRELVQSMKKEDKKNLEPLSYANFFTSEWVMVTGGVPKIEDASIITIPTKQAIAQSISQTNEFVIDRSGFLEKHSGVVIGLMILVFAGVTSLFVFYGANSFYAGITSDIASLAGTVHALNTGIATTTIAPSAPTNASGLITGG